MIIYGWVKCSYLLTWSCINHEYEQTKARDVFTFHANYRNTKQKRKLCKSGENHGKTQNFIHAKNKLNPSKYLRIIPDLKAG